MRQFLSLLLISACLFGNAQTYVPPPTLSFDNNIYPIWNYVFNDPNFVKNPIDDWSSPYSGFYLYPSTLVDGDYLYLAQTHMTQSPTAGPCGHAVVKIGINSGAIEWVRYHTDYTVDSFNRELYFRQPLLKNDNQLTLFGYRANDPSLPDFPQFVFNSQIVERNYNATTGDLVNVVQSPDTTHANHQIVSFGFGYIHNSLTDRYHIAINQDFGDNSLKELIKVFDVNEENTISQTPLFEYVHDTGINSTASMLPLQERTKPDEHLIMFGKINLVEPDMSPYDLNLHWFDLSDKNNIKLIRKKDVTEYMPYPQDGYYSPTLRAVDGQIFLYQPLRLDPNSSSNDTYTWLMWLDNEGNEKAKINKLQSGTTVYDNVALPILANDSIAYILAKASTNKYDILLIKANENTAKRVGRLGIPIGDVFFGPNAATILPNNTIYFNLEVNKKAGNIDHKFNYNMAFRASDLGIDLTTATTTPPNLATALTLAPNPSTGEVTVQLANATAGTLAVIDAQGKTLHREAVESNTTTLHLGHLPKGSYVVQFVDKKGNVSKGVPLVLLR